MDWIATPTAWIGLVLLVATDIVLATGIAGRRETLAAGRPAERRANARHAGILIGLALRIALLVVAAWVLTLAAPLASPGNAVLSPRGLLLVVAGLFLVAKAAFEIHRRLDGRPQPVAAASGGIVSWSAIAKLAVLDMLLSLDTVAAAIGLVEPLPVMVIAMIAATAISVACAKPIAAYLARNPSAVVLCHAILILVGFGLFADGLGHPLPKGALYAAIGLAILVEAIGQFRGGGRDQEFAGMGLRQRTATRVLKLLGRHRRGAGGAALAVEPVAEMETAEAPAFAAEEADMIQGVLTLAERPVRTIMSPRTQVQWIAIDGSPERVRADILRLTHSVALLCRGRLNDFVGVAATTDLLRVVVEAPDLDLSSKIRQPVIVHESTKVLKLMEDLRRSSMPLAIVLDEYGSVAGVATPTDILEAIAGEFPDRDEAHAEIVEEGEGRWIFEGFVDVHRASAVLGRDLVDPNHRYTTLNGYIVWKLGDIPKVGRRFAVDDLAFEILAMKGRTVERVRITRSASSVPAAQSVSAPEYSP